MLDQLRNVFGPIGHDVEFIQNPDGLITVEVPVSESDSVLSIFSILRNDENFLFQQLVDLCGVDYLHYGIDEWATSHATYQGFERAVRPIASLYPNTKWTKPRLAVVYHLLSLTHNHRIRVKVFLEDNNPVTPSVYALWNSANWYEREAFDLFGIIFTKHPDLRRILTDYGFIGHPFRKDFPLSGNVEVRFDKAKNQVIYEPVDIIPRVLVPKVIRET